MLLILVVCSALVSVHGASIKNDYELDGHIVGGHAISMIAAPYQAAFQVGGQQICGASIISSNWILTAAHCSIGRPVSSVSIRVGSNLRSTGGTVHPASQIIIHANYSIIPEPNNDVALVRVSTAFAFSASVRAIELAGSLPVAGTSLVTSGWGRTCKNGGASNTLQQVSVSMISPVDCSKAYPYSMTSSMFCAGDPAGGKDACQGDYGGPLVSAGSLVGVASWGADCSRTGLPGVYASVPHFRSWIQQHAGV